MLTPYDEFPIHQTAHTFAKIPSTDFTWDDGCYFGVFSPKEKIFLACGYRVNPNTDMIGGFAILNINGHQHTVRFSRCWRRNMTTEVGPFKVEVLEPLKKLRISLADNDSGIKFDIVWTGTSPAILEEHHLAENRSRSTTDQTRYCQPGSPEGMISFKKQVWNVNGANWACARDHSWGQYAERRPLSPNPKWLPPKDVAGPQRALRFWIIFNSAPFSGFYHLHEDSNGVQREFSDVFGTPLGGSISEGWDGQQAVIKSASHKAIYHEGTRLLKSVTMNITDQNDGTWTQEFVAAAPPWIAQTSGYMPGGWKDGGNVHTYHGSEELALEWDSFDFKKQPIIHKPYATEAGYIDEFGSGAKMEDTAIQGLVYLCSVTTTAPDGTVGQGAAHVEHFINGAFHPYGFD